MTMRKVNYQRYLGDGVYACFDGYHIWLTTQQGNEIALDDQVLSALDSYRGFLSLLNKKQKEEPTNDNAT